MFGSYLSPQCSSPNESQTQWGDGILTRLIKQLESVENLKLKIQHPDVESTANAVSVYSNHMVQCHVSEISAYQQ